MYYTTVLVRRYINISFPKTGLIPGGGTGDGVTGGRAVFGRERLKFGGT